VSASESKSQAEYTIDQLAARTGVPSRTIRFYQAKGVLPPPTRRGRVAFYDDSHAERLKVVSELQDKGLRLRAIRDFILTPEADGDSVQQWLGIGQRIDRVVADHPRIMSEQELLEMLGDAPPGTLALLRRHGGIRPEGHGMQQRYVVDSPALLRIAVQLDQAGISYETTLKFHEILAKHLSRAADEVVEQALKHLGKGFGRSAKPEDIARAIECLDPDQPGGKATHVIFAREIRRAVSERLKTDSVLRR
jgi:DNA-binding transcriptional MerR regulator